VESINAKFLELDVADPIVPSIENNAPPPSPVSLSLPIVSTEANVQADNEDAP